MVIGGGIVGSTCAYRLQRAGIATQVVDPEPAVDAESPLNAASWNNAGHVASEQAEPLASWKTIRTVPSRLFQRGGAVDVRWTDAGVAAWLLRFLASSGPAGFARGTRALSELSSGATAAWQSLAADLGQPSLFKEGSNVLLWESAATAKAGRLHWQRADIGSAGFRDLTKEELEGVAHLLKRPIAGGLRFVNTGQITDPRALARTLETEFARAGGTRLYRSVTSLVHDQSRTSCVLDDGSKLDADLVVICAGVRSKKLLSDLGTTPPLIAERGYHIQRPVQACDDPWPVDAPSLVFEDRSMVVTRFAGALRACSFVEFAGVDSPPDPRKWERLIAHTQALGIPIGPSPSRWIGARPTLPDYLPAIGRSRRSANVFYAVGHHHLGLTLAAVTAELIATLAVGEVPDISLAPFDIERFN